MSAYTSDENIDNLHPKVTPDPADIIPFGDVSDNDGTGARAKGSPFSDFVTAVKAYLTASLGGFVETVTGLATDNTDPANPVVKIAVDPTTISGDGTPGSPLSALGGGGPSSGGGGGTKLAIDTTQVSVPASSTVDLYTVPIPAGTLGTNNAIKFKIALSSISGSANTIAIDFKYGATTLGTLTIDASKIITNQGGYLEGMIVANTSTGSQKGQFNIFFGDDTQASAIPQMTIYGSSIENSTVLKNLIITATTGSGDSITAEYIVVEAISSINDGIIKQYTAAEDLVAGAPVGISNLVASSVARAMRNAASNTVAPTFQGTYEMCEIDTDTVAIVYKETANTYKAVVATINRGNLDNPLSFGIPVTITTVGGTSIDICKLDTNSFAVAYFETTSSTSMKVVIGTVISSAISLGTPSVVASTAGALNGITICQLDVNKGLVFGTQNVTSGKVVAFSASGNAVSGTGTVVNADSNLFHPNPSACSIGPSKFVIACNGYVQVGTFSVLAVSLGSAVQYQATYTTSSMTGIVSPANDSFVIQYVSGSNNHLIAATSPATTPTFGAIQGTTGTTQSPALYVRSATEVVSYIQNINVITMFSFTLTGNTLSTKSPIIQILDVHVSSIVTRNMIVNGLPYFAILSLLVNTEEHFIEGMANAYIGFAQQTVSRGATVRVLVKGVDSNQSGLIPGSLYSIDNTGLSFMSTGIAINSINDVNYVKAISSTEVLV